MNKVKEIATAWKNVLVGSDEIKEIAAERMAICNSCEFKQHNDLLNYDVCSICLCPLVGKTHSPVDSCPKKKWVR